MDSKEVLEFLSQIKTSNFVFGPFEKDELIKFPFEIGNLDFVKSSLEKYWLDENWGNDLVVFKKQFKEVELLTNNFNNYSKFELFNLENYFNLDDERKKMNYPLGFWGYHIIILAFNSDCTKCFVAVFGLD